MEIPPLLSERPRDRHQALLGERLKICPALPDVGGSYPSGDLSQDMRNEACRGVLAGVQAIGDLFAIISRHALEILSYQYDQLVLLESRPISCFYESEPVAKATASSDVWPLLDLAAADPAMRTHWGNQDLFVVHNNNHSFHQSPDESLCFVGIAGVQPWVDKLAGIRDGEADLFLTGRDVVEQSKVADSSAG
jgi:hypothetical protein